MEHPSLARVGALDGRFRQFTPRFLVLSTLVAAQHLNHLRPRAVSGHDRRLDNVLTRFLGNRKEDRLDRAAPWAVAPRIRCGRCGSRQGGQGCAAMFLVACGLRPLPLLFGRFS